MSIDLLSELRHPTAEQVVVAGLVVDAELAESILRIVSVDDLDSPLARTLGEACRRALRSVEPYDHQTILREVDMLQREEKTSFQINEGLLTSLLSQDTRRAVAYAHTVKRFSDTKRAISFHEWFGQRLQDHPSLDELYPDMMERLRWLQPDGEHRRFTYGEETLAYTDELRKREQAFLRGDAPVFGWPWATWERFISHLRGGLVGIVAAPDGTGKSGMLEQIAEQWAQDGHHVVFAHCENTYSNTLDRRLARWSGVELGKLEDGNFDAYDWELIRSAEESIKPWGERLHYLDGAGMPMHELCGELATRHAEGVCDAVVLDYMNVVPPSRGQSRLHGGDDNGRRADDMNQLKTGLALRCEIPVMTAAQMTKSGKTEQRRKSRSDMRGTGEWSDKAQLVLTMDRQIVEVAESVSTLVEGQPQAVEIPAGARTPVTDLVVDKQNRGAYHAWQMFYDGPRYRHIDLYAPLGQTGGY